MKLKRNKLKDAVIYTVFLILCIPVIPVLIIMFLNDYAEKISSLYEDLVLQPIRNWRNRWNPEE